MSANTVPQKAMGNNTDRRHYLSTNDVTIKKPRKTTLRGFSAIMIAG